MPHINGRSYYRHILSMAELLGLPKESEWPATTTEADVRDEVMKVWNPTHSRPLGHLLGIKWALWNMIHAAELDPAVPLLSELHYRGAPDMIDDAIRQHTISILREYYATLHALEKTYYLNLALKDTERLNQLAVKMQVRRATGAKASGTDESPPMHARFTNSARTSVDSALLAKKLSLMDTRLSYGITKHTNLISAVCLGSVASLEDSVRNMVGDSREGALEVMNRFRKSSKAVARFNNLLNHQHDIMLHEVKLSAKKLNQIPGKTADNRALLVDGGIPQPHAASIIAWLGLCSLGVWENRYGDWYSIIIPPHMPMTFEHKNQGGIVDTTSDADHSLPSKSAGHKRNRFGGIDYGLRVVACLRLRNSPPAGKAVLSWRILPTAAIAPTSLTHDMFMSLGISPQQMRPTTKLPSQHWDVFTSLQWSDPFTNDKLESTLHWHSKQPIRGTYADEPMRAAAQRKLHFRFDSPTALLDWCEAYGTALHAYLTQPPLLFDLHTAGVAASYDSRDLTKVIATKGGNKMKLSFPGF